MESVPYKKIVQEMLKEGVKFEFEDDESSVVETNIMMFHKGLDDKCILNNIPLEKDVYENLMCSPICYDKNESLYVPAPILQLIDVYRNNEIKNLIKEHVGCYNEERFENGCTEIDRKYKNILEFRMKEYKEYRKIMDTHECIPEEDMDTEIVRKLEWLMKSIMKQKN